MTGDNELLDAVDALTKPRRSKVVQSKNGIECISTVETPPLLTVLDTAIRETMGGAAGGTLKSQQNILDTDALWRFIRITNMVNDWARNQRTTIAKTDTAATLRAWYVGYAQEDRDPDVDRFYLTHMRAWAAQIEAKMDPPRVADLPDPCPVCGESTWFSPKTGEEYPRPLVVTWHEGDVLPDDAKGLCRACDVAFGGRELAYAIEQAANGTREGG